VTSRVISPRLRAYANWLADGFPPPSTRNNGYSIGGAIRVGRALEELGYGVRGAGPALIRSRRWARLRAARHHGFRGEQTIHLVGARRSDEVGVPWCSDIVKMAHTGLDALRRSGAGAWRRTGAAPDAAMIGHMAICTSPQASCMGPSRANGMTILAHACGVREPAETGRRLFICRPTGPRPAHQRAEWPKRRVSGRMMFLVCCGAAWHSQQVIRGGQP